MQVIRTLLISALLLACHTTAHAANARVHLTVEIAADGYVSVRQKWDGIHALERLEYDTGTEELGVLEAPVYEGHAEINYSSGELLQRDGDRLILSIARLDYIGNWLDFDISLLYPAGLDFINAQPEPSFMNSQAHGLMWSIAEQRELSLLASFSGELSGGARWDAQSGSTDGDELRRQAEERRRAEDRRVAEEGEQESGSAASRQRRSGESGEDADRHAGNDAENDNTDSPSGTSESAGKRMLRPTDAESSPDSTAGNTQRSDTAADAELLLDGDPLLLEFRLLINAARREGLADEPFLDALEKLLLKFFYLLDAMGATDEYKPE